MRSLKVLLLTSAMLLGGCATDYHWTSSVPEDLRTVAISTFENRTIMAELGTFATQYTAREVQREGTFKLRRTGDSAIEVQGVVTKVLRQGIAFDRSYGTRASEYRYTVVAEVSIINRKTGKVLLNNHKLTAETTFMEQGDILTAQRNAAPRIAQELARQIVDILTTFDYTK